MRSRTAKPFRTTNLLIMTQSEANEDIEYSTCAAFGDALLVDPGCCSEFHTEVRHRKSSLYDIHIYVIASKP